MIVYVTRHGQPLSKNGGEYPPGDPPLSELGREQSRLLGERLKALRFDGAVYSSPYRRTAETANVIARVLETRFRPEPALREWGTQGLARFSGLTLEELLRDYDRAAADAELPHPWWDARVEDEDAVLERVRPFLDGLVREGTGDVLLVGHGASAMACMRYFLEEGSSRALGKMGHTWNCFLSAIRVKPRVEPVCLCDTSHLPPELVTSNSMMLRDFSGPRPC